MIHTIPSGEPVTNEHNLLDFTGAQPSLERRVSGSVRRMSPVPEETAEVVSEVALPLDEDSVQTMSAQQRELQSRAMSISKCRRLSGRERLLVIRTVLIIVYVFVLCTYCVCVACVCVLHAVITYVLS